jgi:hypothetical protein
MDFFPFSLVGEGEPAGWPVSHTVGSVSGGHFYGSFS